MKKRKNLIFLAFIIGIIVYFLENVLAPNTFAKIFKRIRRDDKSDFSKRKSKNKYQKFPVDITIKTDGNFKNTAKIKAKVTKHSTKVVQKTVRALPLQQHIEQEGNLFSQMNFFFLFFYEENASFKNTINNRRRP